VHSLVRPRERSGVERAEMRRTGFRRPKGAVSGAFGRKLRGARCSHVMASSQAQPRTTAYAARRTRACRTYIGCRRGWARRAVVFVGGAECADVGGTFIASCVRARLRDEGRSGPGRPGQVRASLFSGLPGRGQAGGEPAETRSRRTRHSGKTRTRRRSDPGPPSPVQDLCKPLYLPFLYLSPAPAFHSLSR
jgi:hypothetical protein